MKISSKDKLFDKGATMQKLLVVPVLGLLLAGCNPADGTATGVASNEGFSLYCPNVGIAADQCILSDPENPYAGETLDDQLSIHLQMLQLMRVINSMFGLLLRLIAKVVRTSTTRH